MDAHYAEADMVLPWMIKARAHQPASFFVNSRYAARRGQVVVDVVEDSCVPRLAPEVISTPAFFPIPCVEGTVDQVSVFASVAVVERSQFEVRHSLFSRKFSLATSFCGQFGDNYDEFIRNFLKFQEKSGGRALAAKVELVFINN